MSSLTRVKAVLDAKGNPKERISKDPALRHVASRELWAETPRAVQFVLITIWEIVEKLPPVVFVKGAATFVSKLAVSRHTPFLLPMLTSFLQKTRQADLAMRWMVSHRKT